MQVVVVLVAAPWKLPVNEGLDEAGGEVHQRQRKQRARGVVEARCLHRQQQTVQLG